MCCSVNGYVCRVCCVFDSFVNVLVEKFEICLGVVDILLLNVMEVFTVGGGVLLDSPDRVWFSEECACCACDPSVHLRGYGQKPG